VSLAVFMATVLAAHPFARQLDLSRGGPGLWALLLAAHPLVMRVLPLVERRSDVMVTLFALVAFALFARAVDEDECSTPEFDGPPGLAFVAALASKETAIALAPLFGLYALLARTGGKLVAGTLGGGPSRGGCRSWRWRAGGSRCAARSSRRLVRCSRARARRCRGRTRSRSRRLRRR
jgi:hypothetical protein